MSDRTGATTGGAPTLPPDNSLVLIVEDEMTTRHVLATSLSGHGYRVLQAADGHQALDLVGEQQPDIVLLDLGLPDIDGMEVCRQLRLVTRSPIIVVSGESSEDRLVQALDLGADDFVNKPFSMPTLLARIRVALRHRLEASTVIDHDLIEVGRLRIDVPAYQAAVGTQPLDLKPREFKLLTLLARNPGRLVTYKSITQQLWGGGRDLVDLQAVRVSVSLLRKQLSGKDEAPQVMTEPHVGYRLTEPTASASAVASA